jgi:hypothetical protein
MTKNVWRLLSLATAVLVVVSCSSSGSTKSGGLSSPSAGSDNAAASGAAAMGSSSGDTQSSSGGAGATSGNTGSSGAASGNPGVGVTGDAGTGGSQGDGASGSMATSSNDPNTVTITMGSFTVPPNQEVFMCQDFDNPFGGSDAAIGTTEVDMTPGSHHLHVFYGEDSPPSPTVAPCQNPYEFRSLLFVSTVPTLVTQYPAGMAAKLRGSLGLRLQSHYVNTSATEITANVVVKLTKVDPSTITKWIAELYFNRTVLSVPPGNGQQVSTTCTVPSTYGQIGLVSGLSHMHSRGVHFVAATNKGTSLMDTTVWDEPPTETYDPPIALSPGDSITWTCTYDNNTGSTLTFGDSAIKNEMCIYLARFYSAPSGQDIECQSPLATGAGTVSDNVP